MKYIGKAEGAAESILAAFKSGTVPAALAQQFIHRKDGAPCRAWSFSNQLLAALHGYSDARGFRQWEEVGRNVKKGEKAFYILAPLVRKVEDLEKGERSIVYGFKGVPVFGLAQTEGAEIEKDEAAERWLDSLPLVDVARAWGLSVESYNGREGAALGKFSPSRKAIALGVENLSTWAHELIHAADSKLGNLQEQGQHWRSEAVAELGGAVLLECLGLDSASDRGGCWQYIKSYCEAAGVEPMQACTQVLRRTCEAVNLLLESAEALQAAPMSEAAGG